VTSRQHSRGSTGPAGKVASTAKSKTSVAPQCQVIHRLRPVAVSLAVVGDPGRAVSAGTSPDFKQPPLVEVALAVDFLPIADFGALRMAALADRWSAHYPTAQEQPPLPPNVPVGMNPPFAPGMMVSVGAPQIRLWLLNAAEDRLVQVQRDRLILNWRAATDVNPYPRYHQALRPEFEAAYLQFLQFLSEQGMSPPPRVSGVEVTYVNAVPHEAGAGDLASTLRSQVLVTLPLGSPATTHLSQTWQHVREGGLVSVLTLNADTAGIGGDASVISLTARSSVPAETSLSDVLEALDACHDDVVASFVALTTEDSHRAWGLVP